MSELKSPVVSLLFLSEWGDKQVVPYTPSEAHTVATSEGRCCRIDLHWELPRWPYMGWNMYCASMYVTCDWICETLLVELVFHLDLYFPPLEDCLETIEHAAWPYDLAIWNVGCPSVASTYWRLLSLYQDWTRHSSWQSNSYLRNSTTAERIKWNAVWELVSCPGESLL